MDSRVNDSHWLKAAGCSLRAERIDIGYDTRPVRLCRPRMRYTVIGPDELCRISGTYAPFILAQADIDGDGSAQHGDIPTIGQLAGLLRQARAVLEVLRARLDPAEVAANDLRRAERLEDQQQQQEENDAS